MRVALFGGSFDPVHCGHIEPVLEAVGAVGLDRVLYCPTARPPHKRDHEMAPALLRYAMVEAALAPWPQLLVSAHELDNDSESFTLDTVEHFLRARPDWSLSLLLGSDAWDAIETYRGWETILRRVPVVVMSRPGSSAPDPTLETRPLVRAWLEKGRVTFVEGRGVDVSSRELRRRLAEGDDLPEGWLPTPVLELVRKYRLYR